MKKKFLAALVAAAALCAIFSLSACSGGQDFKKVAKFEVADVEKIVMTNGNGSSKTLKLEADLKAVCDALAAARFIKKDESDVAQNEVPYTLAVYFKGEEGCAVFEINKRVKLDGGLKADVKEGWWQVEDLEPLRAALNGIFYGTVL